MTRNSETRVIRAGETVWTGHMASLRRVKDDVREVLTGFECGILLDGYNEISVGDLIQSYEMRKCPATDRAQRYARIDDSAELRLAECHSLKDKRHVLRGMLESIRRKFTSQLPKLHITTSGKPRSSALPSSDRNTGFWKKS